MKTTLEILAYIILTLFMYDSAYRSGYASGVRDGTYGLIKYVKELPEKN